MQVRAVAILAWLSFALWASAPAADATTLDPGNSLVSGNLTWAVSTCTANCGDWSMSANGATNGIALTYSGPTTPTGNGNASTNYYDTPVEFLVSGNGVDITSVDISVTGSGSSFLYYGGTYYPTSPSPIGAQSVVLDSASGDPIAGGSGTASQGVDFVASIAPTVPILLANFDLNYFLNTSSFASAVTVVPAPEPGSLAILASMLPVLAMVVRRPLRRA